MLMKMMERAGVEYGRAYFDIKSFSERTGEFTGYASVFGNEDLGGDVVKSGAFRASLTERPAAKVKMLYEHDPMQPIGKWLDLAEDGHGLRATGLLMIDELQKAKEVHALMKAGQIEGLSIGYRVRKASPDRANRVRVLEDVELREISTVMFPMNELCDIEVVKSSIGDLSLDSELTREFERLLMQDAGLARSKARQVIGGFKSLIKAKQDAGGEEVAMSTQPDADLAPLVDALSAFHRSIR
jgi:hypothetical protein